LVQPFAPLTGGPLAAHGPERTINVVSLRANPYIAPYLARVRKEPEAGEATDDATRIGAAERPASTFVTAEASSDRQGHPHDAAATVSEFVSAEI
jgi:hypothetical protein